MQAPSSLPPDRDPRSETAPAFSVLMAAYETEPYIEEAIHSVVAQTRSDWELIIVDDGSPDGLVERVVPFLSLANVCLIRQPNRGLAAARNRAASVARGRYLAVLDSDDALLPDYLESVGAVLDGRPRTAMVACDALVYLEEPGRFRRRTYLRGPGVRPPRRPNPSRHLEHLLDHNFIYSGATVRASAFAAVGGFDEELRAVEDWDLWIKIAARGVETSVISRPLAVYRLRAGSLSRDAGGTYKLYEPSERMLTKALRELELAPSARRIAKRTLAYCQRRARLGDARAALASGDVARARRLSEGAFRAQPTVKGALILAVLWLAPEPLRELQGRKLSAKRAVRFALARLSLRPG